MASDADTRAPRVVSLLPAATELVAAIGALDALVGVTHECDHPPAVARLPRVTRTALDRGASSATIDAEVRALAGSGAPVFALDASLLAELAPDVVLTQTLCDVCALPEHEISRALAELPCSPAVVALGGSTLAGVWADIRRVGAALGRASEADALVDALASRVRRVHETLAAARAPRPRVAVLEWLDPLFAAGHWVPELVRRAGGIDVLAEPGSHSVVVDVATVRDAAPDLLLFAPCGFDVERAAREGSALLAGDAWRWARGRSAWALDGNALTSRPGPRLVDAIETMAAIVAPALFGAPAATYARRIA